MKWNVLNHLKESLTIFPYDYYDIYLFSKSGFTESLIKLNEDFVHLITIDDMVSLN